MSRRAALIISLLLLPLWGRAVNLRFHAMPETSYYGGIHSIAKDSLGRIWFSGFDAIYMYNGVSFTLMNEYITRQAPERYWSIGWLVTDKNGVLYAATNHGLQRFNCAYHRFEKALDGNIGAIEKTSDGTVWMICDGRITGLDGKVLPLPEGLNPDPMKLSLSCSGEHLYVGSEGRLYRGSIGGNWAFFGDFSPGQVVDVKEDSERIYVLTLSDGLYECGNSGDVIRRFTLPIENDRSSTAKQLYLDSEGKVWVATQYGLMIVCPRSGRTELLRANLKYPFSLPTNSVWSFFPDPDGGVWVGTYGGKLAYATRGDSDAGYFFKATPGGLGHPIVSAFCEDKEGHLWIGTDGGGITVWDRNKGDFRYYTQQDGSGLSSNMVKKLWTDKNGTIWASFFNSGVQTFDSRSGRFRALSITRGPDDDPLSVYDFVPDGKGGIWMSDPDSRFMHASLDNGKISRLSSRQVRQVETFFNDGKGCLWLLTHQGLHVLDDSTLDVLRTYRLEGQSYAVNNLCCYCRCSNGELLLGTKGGGLNVLAKDGTYTNIPLNGRTVFGIVEDPVSKEVWFSTDEGLFRRTDGRIVPSTLNTPSHCGAFYVRSAFVSSKGELMFGGTDGFILFRPGDIRTNQHKSVVFFTDVRVNASPVPTEQYIGPNKSLSLNHRQSNIALGFSSDSYLHAENNRYACRLVGLSDEWTTLDPGQNTMRYYDLNPGSYRFEVKASNNDGLWGDSVTAMELTIHPSPFLSWWAQMLYAIIVLALIYLVWRFFTNKKIYRHELEMEKLKEKNMQELSRARIKFFTNISHDLKTPLTLIVDPLRKLKERLPEDSPANKYAVHIERNVSRIQRMIGQLLTFREIESNKVTLNPVGGDLVSFLRSIFSLFEIYADRKGIEMDFRSQSDSYPCLFDHEVIEKIFTNIFSNAVKYTVEQGSIVLQIKESGSGIVEVSVSNTGNEIPEDKLSQIFEAFNRTREFQPSFETSTGLGLAIVKELVDEIGGKISVSSGNAQVVFTVSMPLPPAPHSLSAEEDESLSYGFVEKEVDALIEELDVSEQAAGQSRKAHTIVVIDDDEQLRSYLQEHLSARFNVYSSADGADGIEKVDKVHPNLVITDLMMGDTDGFEVCRHLRGSLKSSHIPVVVLSGNGDMKVKAMESGANVFIEKPFDMEFLLSQVDGLLRMQEELRNYYSKKFVAEPSKLVISSMDEALLSKAMDAIEKNMDNNEYDVDEFVYDMAVGRTILYQKIKDITGMSIKEFILDIRLKRAAQLLKDSDLTISEISDRTGFANPKYFSVCFKRRYDISPSDFKKQENPA